MTETAARKDIQRLQRVIVDALEDVKAQDIRVFNTEHLSPLFERVIIASGTSNRQTKALSASVRDKVRDGGFGKPRIEGEDNGEWIIADCGAAVVHIMQPVIRQYYNLEENRGDKPVRLRFGSPRPAAASDTTASATPVTERTRTTRSASASSSTSSARPPKPAASPKVTLKTPLGPKAAKTAAKATGRTATSPARVPRPPVARKTPSAQRKKS
ncbi:MAG: ribosome silencing factor [Limnohabitans sp.]